MRDAIAIAPLMALSTEQLLPATGLQRFSPQTIAIRRRNNPRLSLIASAGMGITSTQLSGAAAQSKYITSLKTAQTNLPVLQADLLLQLNLSNDWSIQGGVSYTRVTYRTMHSWEKTQRIEYDGETLFIDPNGNITSVPVVTMATENTAVSARYHTYLNSIDLPVAVSYRILSIPRLRISGRAGVLIPLTMLSRGAIPDPESGALYKWTSQKDSPYAKFSTGYLLGTSIEFNAGRNLALVCSPMYTHRTTKVIYHSIALDQSISVFACTLGARIQF
jgi:hypothetical protein